MLHQLKSREAIFFITRAARFGWSKLGSSSAHQENPWSIYRLRQVGQREKAFMQSQERTQCIGQECYTVKCTGRSWTGKQVVRASFIPGQF